jgi:hypothetical protein
MKTMLVDPRQNKVAWAIKERGAIVASGICPTFVEVRGEQLCHALDSVFVDDGYRTHEVRKACKIFGWVPVRGPGGTADEIKAATEHLSGVVRGPCPDAVAR